VSDAVELARRVGTIAERLRERVPGATQVRTEANVDRTEFVVDGADDRGLWTTRMAVSHEELFQFLDWERYADFIVEEVLKDVREDLGDGC